MDPVACLIQEARTSNIACIVLRLPVLYQLSNHQSQKFQLEKQVLGFISSQYWVLGTWPGNMFKGYSGESKRYFEDKEGRRYLVEVKLFSDEEFFMGLCFDAWSGAGLDSMIYMKGVATDPSILRDPYRMYEFAGYARQQAQGGRGLFHRWGPVATGKHGLPQGKMAGAKVYRNSPFGILLCTSCSMLPFMSLRAIVSFEGTGIVMLWVCHSSHVPALSWSRSTEARPVRL